MHAGIDAGTTWSRIAAVGVDGTPRLVPDALEQQRLATRSVVHIATDGAVVGEAVLDLCEQQPDLPVADNVPAHLGGSTPILSDDQQREWMPVTLAAVLLRKLRRDLAAQSDETLDGTALAVPPNYSESQRADLLTAANAAGFTNVSLVAAPLAAAAFHGLHQTPAGTTALVCDVGASHVTLSVVRVVDGRLKLVAHDELQDSGANTIDRAIAELIAEQFARHHSGYDPRSDPTALMGLARHAESIKREFVNGQQTVVERSLLLGGRVQQVRMTRAQAEKISDELIQQILVVAARVVLTGGLQPEQIGALLMVGGGASLPGLAARLSQEFPQAQTVVADATQSSAATAFGAAMVARHPELVDSDGQPPAEQLEAAPADIGFLARGADGSMAIDPVIRRGTPLPATETRTLHRTHAGQDHLLIALVRSGDNGAPPTPLRQIRTPLTGDSVDVSVEYSNDGQLTLTTGTERHRIGDVSKTLTSLDADQRQILETTRLIN